jgi:hypothetical protein
MKPQKNNRGILPQFSRLAMLISVLDPRHQKEKLAPRRNPGKLPAIISLPHNPDAPILLIKPSSGSLSATQSYKDNTKNPPPRRSQTPLFCEQGVLFGYWHEDPLRKGSRHPVYAYPKEREFTIK